MRTRGHTCMQGLHVRSRRTCPSLYMHNDYMPIRGVQGRIHIYNTSGGRKRGKIVGGRAPLLVLMSNRPEELVQHVWSIWLISLCGQPDANLRSISDRTRNCVSGRKSYDCEKLLLPKCIRRQPIEPWIHSWWGIDPHVRLLVSPRLSSRVASRRVASRSHRETRPPLWESRRRRRRRCIVREAIQVPRRWIRHCRSGSRYMPPIVTLFW